MKRHRVSSEKLFFTSDLHFYHKNIIRFCNRPYENVDEMNQAIIDNWNSVVPVDGVVYITGDISWKGIEETRHLLDQLNGKKILIIGNHDNDGIIDYFDENFDMLELNINDKVDGFTYSAHLCHFPLQEWNRDRSGSIMIHGHCHGSLDYTDRLNCKRIDVGVDSHQMKPISWEEIKIILNSRNLNSL